MRIASIIALAIVLPSFPAGADDAGGICPEFANSVAVMRKGGKPSVELQLEKASGKQKKKGIYRGWDQSVHLAGAKAKAAVRGSAAFAFRPMNPKVNPNQQIKLYPFKSVKDHRELMVGGMSAWGGTKQRSAEDDSIGLKFKKISDGCYKVTPVAELPKGQYAFSLGSKADVEGSTTFGATTQGQTWFGFGVP